MNHKSLIRNLLIVALTLLTVFNPVFTDFALAQIVTPIPPVSFSSQSASASSQDPIINSDFNSDSPLGSSPSESPVYPSFSQTQSFNSAQIRVPTLIRNLTRHSFRANEKIEVDVDNASASVKLYASIRGLDGKDLQVETFTRDEGSRKVVVINPPVHFKPGKYSITVTSSDGETSTQDFTWGVLAINTNKSIFSPAETAKLAIAVLDDGGDMVCNAEVSLIIIAPDGGRQTLSTDNGRIKVNDICNKHEVSLTPDFEADYVVGTAGNYLMDLSAKISSGNRSISDSFQVRNSVPFDVERLTATRIYPIDQYPVNFSITANQDFKGTVAEVVPSSFAVDQNATSDKPFVSEEASKTSLSTLLSSESAKLELPYEGHYPIEQEFGEQLLRDPAERNLYAFFNLAGHDGIDFGLPEGTPVLSADDGKISFSGPGAYGTTVVIDHSWGRTYYGHLSLALVKLGQEVRKGEKIGLSGHTGLATGPHLHFGMKSNNHDINNGYYGKIDPLPFLGLQSYQDNGLKVLSWKIDVKKGDKVNLGYLYRAPNISPQFYTLGTAKFFDESQKLIFTESRQWQIAADATGVVSRVLTGNNGGVAVSATNLQYFLPVVTGALNLSQTEADRRITFRSAGTLSNLRIRVVSGNRSANNPRVNFHLNGVEQTGAGMPEILLAPGGTPVSAGEYVDSTNTLSVSSGDTLSFHVASGGSGNANWTFTLIGADFTPSTGTVTHLAGIGVLSPSLNTTSYVIPGSDNTASTTQANGEWLVKLPAGTNNITLRNLYVYASADTIGTSDVTITVNGATGSGTAPNVAFHNGGAAVHEDTSNSIVANNGDKISFKIVVPNTTGALTLQTIALEAYDSSTGVSFLVTGSAGGVIIGSSNQRTPLAGVIAFNGTELRSEATMSFAATLSLLSAYLPSTTATAHLDLRAGAADAGSPSVMSVSEASTGWVTDTTNTYSAAAADLMNYNNVRTAGTATFTCIALTVQVGGGAVETPTLSQLLKNGAWYNSAGVEQPFTF